MHTAIGRLLVTILQRNSDSQKAAAAAAAGAAAAAAAVPEVLVVNNLDWFKGISFLSFLRDVGKFARVGTMLAKDSVGNGGGQGLIDVCVAITS